MIAYQRYNALLMLMVGLKDGEFSNAALHRRHGRRHDLPGERSVPAARSTTRWRSAPIAIDKPRASARAHVRPRGAAPGGAQPTLEDILAGRVKGRLYDAYRQSWVASLETEYVAAGNAPLRADA